MPKLSKIAKIASSAGLLSTVLINPALAQQSNTTTASGLEISAPSYQFSMNPGDVKQEIVKLKNVGTQAQTYYPFVADFKASENLNEAGTPIFLKPEETSGTYSLKNWVSFSKNPIKLDPQKSDALNFNITAAKDAVAGSRHAGLCFTTQPAAISGSGVAIVTELCSLLLVNVTGPDAKESASLKEFKVEKNSYNDSKEVKFTTTISNDGNVDVQPKGTITITNLFGAKTQVIDVNALGANVLAGSSRRFDLTWSDDRFHLGLYKAKLTLAYGDPAKALSSEVTFWILPWATILILLAVLVIVLLVLYFGIKRYNRWIISKANQQSNP
jgi:hypothetical protein